MLTCCTCNRHVYKVTCRFIGFSVFSSYKLPSLCSPHTHPVTNTVYEPPIWRDPELSTVVHLTHLDSFSPLVSLLLCSNLDSQTGRDCSCPAQCLLTFWLFFCLFVCFNGALYSFKLSMLAPGLRAWCPLTRASLYNIFNMWRVQQCEFSTAQVVGAPNPTFFEGQLYLCYLPVCPLYALSLWHLLVISCYPSFSNSLGKFLSSLFFFLFQGKEL